MIAVVLVLSLMSLLVATDPEPVGAPVQPTPEPPLRPVGKAVRIDASESDQLAA